MGIVWEISFQASEEAKKKFDGERHPTQNNRPSAPEDLLDTLRGCKSLVPVRTEVMNVGV